jgi:preprotein translocase subunit YajC
MRHDFEAIYLLPQEGERPDIAFGGGAPAGGEATQGTADDTGAGSGDQETPGIGGFWIMLALLFVFMWLFVIRPESRRRKQQQEFQSSLAKGDAVVTAGSLHGTIAAIDETTVTLKVSDTVSMKFDRNAVGRRASAPAEETPAGK